MDDDKLICQICLEKYDQHNITKTPKKVTCCGQVFCLDCLEKIYDKNNKQILCPLCRKTTNTPPQRLETVKAIFDAMATCPSCNGKITKNDLYINFETMTLKCLRCQQGDMPLDMFLPELVNDLSSFISGIKRNNMNLYKLMELKIKQNLDDFFTKIKQELASQLRDIFYAEIKAKLQYDIINDVSTYNDNLEKLSDSYNVMNNFLYNTESFEVNKLKDEIQYYSQHMENIRIESTKFDSVFKFIDTPSTLFNLRNDIKEREVQKFLLNIFETVLSDHKLDSFYTGIDIFDSQIKETRNKIEKVLIDKEHLLKQIYNFENERQKMSNEIKELKQSQNNIQNSQPPKKDGPNQNVNNVQQNNNNNNDNNSSEIRNIIDNIEDRKHFSLFDSII